MYQNFLLKTVCKTLESTPAELVDKDVSKVNDMIPSLGNEETSHPENSAAEAQGASHKLFLQCLQASN